MKKSSEIQKIRNTKILLSDEDWEEEVSMQRIDLDLLRSGILNLKQISLISQRATKRLQKLNRGTIRENPQIEIYNLFHPSIPSTEYSSDIVG